VKAGFNAGTELKFNQGEIGSNQGVVMQTRVILLCVLFLIVALFYNTVTRQNMPNIEAKQKVQTEMMNTLDERVLARTQSEN
jgi:hypothetical protein